MCAKHFDWYDFRSNRSITINSRQETLKRWGNSVSCAAWGQTTLMDGARQGSFLPTHPSCVLASTTMKLCVLHIFLRQCSQCSSHTQSPVTPVVITAVLSQFFLKKWALKCSEEVTFLLNGYSKRFPLKPSQVLETPLTSKTCCNLES